jgi:quercetin dioxygenase-like cupin family protein
MRSNKEENMLTAAKWIAAVAAATAFVCLAQAQDSPGRKEMKRAGLTGTQMEVILSTGEYKPGESVARHIHHGEEAIYILEGATVETPDGKQIELKTGTGSINLRDVPHAGFKVVGDKPLKLLTVHIVDKGVPLYDAPPK